MHEVMISTARLALCYPEVEDFGALLPILSDPAVMAMAFGGQAMSREAAQEFFEREFDWNRTGAKPGVLRDRASGAIIGFAGLKACAALDAGDFELGFVLAKNAWGKGYATEIGFAQLAYGFDTLGCTRLLGLVSPHNMASRQALRKLGMEYCRSIVTPERGERQVFVKEKPCRAAA